MLLSFAENDFYVKEGKITDSKQIQELFLAIMPVWHYKLAKPFKQLLLDNVSLDMYYCIQILRQEDKEMTMTELSNAMHMQKQRMTKIVDGLIEHQLAERVSDPNDRRIVRIRLTENAFIYINKFLDEYAVYFREITEGISDEQKDEIGSALTVLLRALKSAPSAKESLHCLKCEKREESNKEKFEGKEAKL